MWKWCRDRQVDESFKIESLEKVSRVYGELLYQRVSFTNDKGTN